MCLQVSVDARGIGPLGAGVTGGCGNQAVSLQGQCMLLSTELSLQPLIRSFLSDGLHICRIRSYSRSLWNRENLERMYLQVLEPRGRPRERFSPQRGRSSVATAIPLMSVHCVEEKGNKSPAFSIMTCVEMRECLWLGYSLLCSGILAI